MTRRRAINLVELDRLARKRFGPNAAAVLAGQSSIGSGLMRVGAPPQRDVPYVVVPPRRPDVNVGFVPREFAVSEPRDEVEEHFAALEKTRPDLLN